MFKSAIVASVCAIGISATLIDNEMELSASVDSHKKRRYYNPGPRLIVVDQGPNYPPPPPPRAPTPRPRRVVRRVIVQQPQRIIPGNVYHGGYYSPYGSYGGYGYGGYGGYGHGQDRWYHCHSEGYCHSHPYTDPKHEHGPHEVAKKGYGNKGGYHGHGASYGGTYYGGYPSYG